MTVKKKLTLTHKQILEHFGLVLKARFLFKSFLLTSNLAKRSRLGVCPANRAFSRKKGVKLLGPSSSTYKLLVRCPTIRGEYDTIKITSIIHSVTAGTPRHDRHMMGSGGAEGGGGDGSTGREVQKLA